jgi:hypothetical protein
MITPPNGPGQRLGDHPGNVSGIGTMILLEFAASPA